MSDETQPLAIPEVFNNKVKFCATGRVCSRARVATKENRGEIRELTAFKLYFVEHYPDSILTRLGDTYTTEKIQDRVRSTFSTTRSYTDQDGVVQEFDEPRGSAWWIEIDRIQWTIQKLRTEQSPEGTGPKAA